MSPLIESALEVALETALTIYKDGGLTAESLATAITAGVGAAEKLLPPDVKIACFGYSFPLQAIADLLRPLLAASVKAVVKAAAPGKVVVETGDDVTVTGTIKD